MECERVLEYIEFKRKEMYKKWNRVLPTNELFFDRWEKGKLLNSGEGTTIYDSSVIIGNIEIGKHVWIGPFTVLEGINGKLKIGDYCNISSGVQIFTHDSVKSVLTGGGQKFDVGDVEIGNNTYIGGMCIITKGVKIGSHCVIGANSFVNKDIPSYSIVYGTPAKVVGKVIINNSEVEYKYFNNQDIKM